MMSQSIHVKKPKYTCSFSNLWFKLLMYSNNITYERLIYKYIVYPVYIIGLYLMILSIDNNNDRLDIIILSTVMICIGGIGSIFDILSDYEWSPTKEIYRCCCCKCCKKKETEKSIINKDNEGNLIAEPSNEV